MEKYQYFSPDDICIINDSVAMAEELVSNHYKLSATQLLHLNYDVKTLADLSENEIVKDHFAQIIRYAEKTKNDLTDVPVKDFYKVCIQDHSIIRTMKKFSDLDLYAFSVYIVCHELIHIIRFRRFLQCFDAPANEKMNEEVRVHVKTHEILNNINIKTLPPVLEFYKNWCVMPEGIKINNNFISDP